METLAAKTQKYQRVLLGACALASRGEAIPAVRILFLVLTSMKSLC